jgi:hypothetical protein
MGKTLGTFNTYTARGSEGAKMEAADSVRALARRFEMAAEDLPVDDRDITAKIQTIKSLVRQVTETIQRLEWAEER